MCGGFGNTRQADDEIRSHLNEIKQNIEAHLNSKFETFEPINYTTQVVAGTNFKVKVDVGEGKYIHVKYHRPLPCNGSELSLMEASAGHSLEDQL